MFFNKAIIEELGLESPYDLVAKNEWTFDKFLEYEKAAYKDLNGDGVMDDKDRYGFAAGHDWDVSVVMYLASGNKILKQESDGSITYGVNTPEAFDAINQIKQMVAVGDTFYPKPEGSDMDAYVEAFVQGKALFYTYSRGRGVADKIYDMEDDFGIIPMPKYDDAQEQYYTYVIPYDIFSASVPITVKDPDVSGTVLQAIAILSDYYVTPAYYDITITGKGLRDEESAEMLDIILGSTVYDLARMYDWGTVASGLTNNIIAQKEFPSFYAKLETKTTAALEKTIEVFAANKN
jgi:hypothetical protein